MTTLAIIGGTGLSRMEGLTIDRREMVKTPFGAPSCPILFGQLNGLSVAFLARHGSKHQIPPHQINYCANMWALNYVGIERIIAVGSVGGIADECELGTVVVPDQIIDYTHGRENSFYDGTHGLDDVMVRAIDFSEPYDIGHLRSQFRSKERDRCRDSSNGARRLHHCWNDGHARSRLSS